MEVLNIFEVSIHTGGHFESLFLSLRDHRKPISLALLIVLNLPQGVPYFRAHRVGLLEGDFKGRGLWVILSQLREQFGVEDEWWRNRDSLVRMLHGNHVDSAPLPVAVLILGVGSLPFD